MVELPLSDLTYWQDALQGEFSSVHENDPQEGWYRTKPRKGYRAAPVRIWRDAASGSLLAERNGKRIDPGEVWTWCCMNPVSEDTYNEVLETGGPWPDEAMIARHIGALRREQALRARKVHDPRLQPSTDRVPAIQRKSPPHTQSFDRPLDSAADNQAFLGIGHNSSDAVATSSDEAKSLNDEIAALWAAVAGWLAEIGKISDQVVADRCANYADLFADFEKKAEGFRTAEKRPVLDRGRDIDRLWKPIVAAAEEAKRACKTAVEPYLIGKAEEQERALRDRLAKPGGPLGDLMTLENPKAGSFGRTISLRRVRRAHVTDRSALMTHYHHDPRFLADEAVQKLLIKLAETDLEGGRLIPGVEMIETRVVA